ncbi:MAG: hypothetical protein RQ833_00665 [Sphingomonadaceae bacterium]|nr:hypothetical protein [Sphingomonadaceae bacterium]
MSSSPAARLALFLAAIQQVLAPVFIFPRGFRGFSAGESVPTPAEPAIYAFGIWAVIYVACLVFAVIQLLPRYAGMPAVMTVRWRAAALFTGSTLWLIAAKEGPSWLTVLIIWGMFAFALAAMMKLARWPVPLPRSVKMIAGWPLALYTGWLSLAAFVNTAAILPFWTGNTGGLGVDGLAVVMLGLAAVGAAAIISRARGPIPYTVAVLWGLAAVAAANGGHMRGEAFAARVFNNSAEDVPLVFWTALAAMVATLAALGIARSMRPRHLSHSGHHHGAHRPSLA